MFSEIVFKLMKEASYGEYKQREPLSTRKKPPEYHHERKLKLAMLSSR